MRTVIWEVRLSMDSILREYFNSLKGKRVAVIGLGVSNKPLVEGYGV